MANWSFLTNHARALLHIAREPDAPLRSIAVDLGVSERTAFGLVTALTEAGYVVKQKEGRRNRYVVQTHLPIPDDVGRQRSVGELLGLLLNVDSRTNDERARPVPPGPPTDEHRRGVGPDG